MWSDDVEEPLQAYRAATTVAHWFVFFFSSRRRHTRLQGDWSSDVCSSDLPRAEIDRVFALPTVAAMVQALEAADGEWAQHTAATLRKRSPLMLHVVLEQIRRARGMTLAQDLRMERDMVRHCFYLRPGQSETIEGIRALAVDKDHHRSEEHTSELQS